MPSRIRTAGFQGELGAFSHMAIRQMLGPGVKATPFPVFEQVFKALAAGKIDAAMIPVENTLHGSVHENYDHLLKYGLPIVGETTVRIVHNLIVTPGTKFTAIKKVFSHPVALNQCLNFFAAHPEFEKTTFYDTAGSIKMLLESRPAASAGIASALAAELYGCRILKRGIEDDHRNFTRFVLLRQKVEQPKSHEGAKVSLVFTTRNVPGSLFRALSAFALRDISLLKIESRPLRGKPWEYLFYLDFLGHVDEPRVRKALGHLQELADVYKVLGCYPRGAAQ
ncbi:MAG: prephenate dehydratase [Acidobacteria bacterium]|nr:prephenate dehydratase [Acidobacteriota bacterium]